MSKGYIAHTKIKPEISLSPAQPVVKDLMGNMVRPPVSGRTLRGFSPVTGGLQVGKFSTTQTVPIVQGGSTGGISTAQPAKGQPKIPVTRSILTLERALSQVNAGHLPDEHWTEKDLVETLENHPSYQKMFDIVDHKGDSVTASELQRGRPVLSEYDVEDQATIAAKYLHMVRLEAGDAYCVACEVRVPADDVEKHANSAKHKQSLPKKRGRPKKQPEEASA